MRVTCETITEFLECLDADPNVFQNCIRISTIRKPLDGKTRFEADKFEVIFQASAVVFADETSQYLLEVGLSCGRDLETADGHKNGSQLALEYKATIKRYAEYKALKVLPGMIDL